VKLASALCPLTIFHPPLFPLTVTRCHRICRRPHSTIFLLDIPSELLATHLRINFGGCTQFICTSNNGIPPPTYEMVIEYFQHDRLWYQIQRIWKERTNTHTTVETGISVSRSIEALCHINTCISLSFYAL
jgi:hypothetical protein